MTGEFGAREARMCELLHRLSEGPLPTWLVMPHDVQDAQRLAALGWIQVAAPHDQHVVPQGSDPPALLVTSITADGQAAIDSAEFGLWDLRMGCATVCMSCPLANTCPNVALPQLLTPRPRQSYVAEGRCTTRPLSMADLRLTTD